MKKWRFISSYAIILALYFFAQGIFNITFPIYLSENGYSYTEIGSLLASSGLIIAFFKMMVGKHSDKVGKKRYILGALVANALFMYLFIFATQKWHYVLLMFLKGAASGAFMAVRAPLIRENVEEKSRGKAFGYIAAISSFGMAIGGMGAGFLSNHSDMKGIFGLNTIIFFIAFLIGINGIKDNRRKSECKEMNIQKKNIVKATGWIESLKSVSPMIWLFCAINFIQCIVNAPLWSLVLPLHMTETLGISIVFMGYIYTVDNIMGVADSILGGYISDHWRTEKIFSGLLFSTAVLAFAMAIIKTKILFVILLLLFMFAFGVNSPAQEKLESISTKGNSAGFELGLISLAVTLGGSIGQYVLGWVMENFSTQCVFIVVGIGYLMIGILWKLGYNRGKYR